MTHVYEASDILFVGSKLSSLGRFGNRWVIDEFTKLNRIPYKKNIEKVLFYGARFLSPFLRSKLKKGFNELWRIFVIVLFCHGGNVYDEKL